MRGIALDGGNKIRDQIGPPLVLIHNFAPGGLGIFVQSLEIVVAAPWQPDKQHSDRNGGEYRNATAHSSPPSPAPLYKAGYRSCYHEKNHYDTEARSSDVA